MLSEQNVQALGTALRNAGELTESLKNASRELQPAMAKIGPLVDSLGDASRRRAAREVGDLAQQARQSLARLNAPDGPLATATRSLSDIASAAARLDGETLPAITGMAQNIGQAARGATSTLRRVDSTPQSCCSAPRRRRRTRRSRIRRLWEHVQMKMRSAFLVLTLALAGCGVGRVGTPPSVFDLGADLRPALQLPARAPIALATRRCPRCRTQASSGASATARRPNPMPPTAGLPRRRTWCVSA